MKSLVILMAAMIVTLGIGGAIWYATTQYTLLKERELANEARYHCAISSRYETKDASGALVSYPVADLYKKCLEEKGMK